MKKYVALLVTVEPVRTGKIEIVPLGDHQDAMGASAHFIDSRRKKATPETPTIVICSEEDRERHVAALTKEQGGSTC